MKTRKLERLCENLIGFVFGILTLGFYRTIRISTHHEMTIEAGRNPLFKATYRQFRDVFNTIEWEWQARWPDGLFNDKARDRFYADIIDMRGVAFYLTSYGFLRANILRRRKIRELRGLNFKNEVELK